jgi:DNA-binding transcriptional MerR regulator
MARDGLLIGEVAGKSGVSRKALRLYEKAGILPPPRRTGSGYRMYGPETLGLLGFVTQARRLGFRLEEIKRIVVLKRSGRTPCKHVLDLVQLKLNNIDQALTDRSWQSRRHRFAAVCPCIEHLTIVKGREVNQNGKSQGVAVPNRVWSVPRRGDGRR